MNINEHIKDKIINIAKSYSDIGKVVLFGSRARGDHSANSDIDIAVFSYQKKFTNWSKLYNDIDNIDTLYKFDIVKVDDNTDKLLLENIIREGIVIMERNTKLQNYTNAVARLNEAIIECGDIPTTLNRDGVIQRFEFCTELAWKSTRETLIKIGFEEINSPKAVMKEAFANKIINDEYAWIEIFNDRNQTSHIYNEDTATEIFNNIKNRYLMCFNDLRDKLLNI